MVIDFRAAEVQLQQKTCRVLFFTIFVPFEQQGHVCFLFCVFLAFLKEKILNMENTTYEEKEMSC